MNAPGRVGRSALLLGYAGLLPQAAAVAGLLRMPFAGAPSEAVALFYPLLILSFLGGIWWGFAMQRTDRQARLAALAILPSLTALLLIGMFAWSKEWGLVAIGCALILTLLIDRHLVATGEAPANWMTLRTPLSAGLGLLTILAGVLVSQLPAPL